jgi:hypothetical protein
MRRRRWRATGVTVVSSIGTISCEWLVDVPDTPGNRQWMREFKGRWKSRLEQLEVWVMSFRIDVE